MKLVLLENALSMREIFRSSIIYFYKHSSIFFIDYEFIYLFFIVFFHHHYLSLQKHLPDNLPKFLYLPLLLCLEFLQCIQGQPLVNFEIHNFLKVSTKQNMKFLNPHIFYIVSQQDFFFIVYLQGYLFTNTMDHKKENFVIVILDFNFSLEHPICAVISCLQ